MATFANIRNIAINENRAILSAVNITKRGNLSATPVAPELGEAPQDDFLGCWPVDGEWVHIEQVALIMPATITAPLPEIAHPDVVVVVGRACTFGRQHRASTVRAVLTEI